MQDRGRLSCGGCLQPGASFRRHGDRQAPWSRVFRKAADGAGSRALDGLSGEHSGKCEGRRGLPCTRGLLTRTGHPLGTVSQREREAPPSICGCTAGFLFSTSLSLRTQPLLYCRWPCSLQQPTGAPAHIVLVCTSPSDRVSSTMQGSRVSHCVLFFDISASCTCSSGKHSIHHPEMNQTVWPQTPKGRQVQVTTQVFHQWVRDPTSMEKRDGGIRKGSSKGGTESPQRGDGHRWIHWLGCPGSDPGLKGLARARPTDESTQHFISGRLITREQLEGSCPGWRPRTMPQGPAPESRVCTLAGNQ